MVRADTTTSNEICSAEGPSVGLHFRRQSSRGPVEAGEELVFPSTVTSKSTNCVNSAHHTEEFVYTDLVSTSYWHLMQDGLQFNGQLSRPCRSWPRLFLVDHHHLRFGDCYSCVSCPSAQCVCPSCVCRGPAGQAAHLKERTPGFRTPPPFCPSVLHIPSPFCHSPSTVRERLSLAVTVGSLGSWQKYPGQRGSSKPPSQVLPRNGTLFRLTNVARRFPGDILAFSSSVVCAPRSC